MADFILVDGDTVTFMPTFGLATVGAQPGNISGSGPGTIAGKKMCVDGDEASVEVANCPYFTPVYSIPGLGTLKIDKLAGNQKAKKTKTGGALVLLKGVQFEAIFEVDTPAKQPPPGASPPQDDTTKSYSGFGSFTNSNMKFKGA